MKSALKAALLSLASTLVLSNVATADQLEDVKSRGMLSVGVKNDYRPFGYIDAAGDTIGFEIDLAKYIAEKIIGPGAEVELVPVVASNRIELLNAGRIDLIIATLGVNEDRKKVIDFTEEFYSMAGLVLMAPKGGSWPEWTAVEGKTLCGIQGNLYNRTLEETLKAKLLLFPGTAEMFSAYEGGRCEAIAFDGPILQAKLAEGTWGEKNELPLPAYDYSPIAGGVRKGEPAFLKAVNDAILTAEASGFLLDAEAKYEMGESDYMRERAEKAKAAGF